MKSRDRLSLTEKQKAEVKKRLEEKRAHKIEIILNEKSSHIKIHSWDDVRRIDRAIRRLDRGMYGRCIECRAYIEGERLKFMIEAERCASCHEHIESLERRH